VGSQISTRVSEALRRQLDAGCTRGVFPGASACAAIWEGRAWRYLDACAGVRAEGAEEVTPDTIYDLASLTKPWVGTAALRLYQAGLFPLDAPVESLIGEAAGLPIGAQTWEAVLSHRSGLAAWEPFYERLTEEPGSNEARAWILADLLPRWDASAVGTSVYSDLGYILAGMAMARAVGESLDTLVEERVAMPLGLSELAFYGASRRSDAWASACAPTGWSAWRARILCGEVHDDNCAALGGIAGHAGMFGTARGVASFGAACVGGWHGRRGALEEESSRFATAPRPGGTHRLGWDGRSEAGSAAGTRMDLDAFGHLGFTGTSIWCDPRRQLVIALLTNRVAVSDDNTAIRELRPAFHDAVVDAFDGR
jgi:CubicO group peptidase (beta-lactamase class C family)